MSSLLPSGCILIGMSCFCFLFSCPLAHCAVFHTHAHIHIRARSLSRLPLTLPSPVCKREFNIAYFCAHAKKKIVSGIRFVCHLASFFSFLFPSSFFLACLQLLGPFPPLPLLLLMHIHICVPCVYLPKRGLCDFWLRANFE